MKIRYDAFVKNLSSLVKQKTYIILNHSKHLSSSPPPPKKRKAKQIPTPSPHSLHAFNTLPPSPGKKNREGSRKVDISWDWMEKTEFDGRVRPS